VVIREASREDLEELLDLYTEFYNELRFRQGLRPRDREDYRGDVEGYLSRDKLFLAKGSDGRAAGFIRISECAGCYWFEELYVRPEHRGRGVGGALVREAENYVRGCGGSYAYVMVLPKTGGRWASGSAWATES